MSNISTIDKNFNVSNSLNNDNIVFTNVRDSSCSINGVFWEDGKFRRITECVAQSISEGVLKLHTNTSGGRIRFKTNSSFVAIRAVMGNIGRMPHFSLTGTCGFDLYVNNQYVKTFIPPIDIDKHFESIIEFRSNEMRDIIINMPLYSDVEEMYIGIEKETIICEPMPYLVDKPIVFYGSSITQGGCASRPGMTYPAIVSRKLNCDFLNLGFSGNAKGEDEIIEYIKKLKMSLFVLDYDHNAPTIEHLKKTHEKMYYSVRENNPELPIIIMCRPRFNIADEEKERCDVILSTYHNALLRNDKNVYFITGEELTKECGEEGTVDDTHPTDFGFMSMAKAIIKVVKSNNILL